MSVEKGKVKSEKERPILFSTDMVKAILDGRKTQTRRVVKPSPEELAKEQIPEWDGTLHQVHAETPSGERIFGFCTDKELRTGEYYGSMKSKYGNPGDVLYVRETWMPAGWSEDGDDWCIHYKANGPDGMIVPHLFDDEKKEHDFWMKVSGELKDAGCPEVDGMFQDVTAYLNWRPSIFMPKNASRLWLKVKEVKVERVQGITFEDAVAEGIEVDELNHVVRDDGINWGGAVPEFANLWDSINAKRDGGIYSWESNPYVWVVKFEVVSTNGRPSYE